MTIKHEMTQIKLENVKLMNFLQEMQVLLEEFITQETIMFTLAPEVAQVNPVS